MRHMNSRDTVPTAQARQAPNPAYIQRMKLKGMSPKERQRERTRIAKERHLTGVSIIDIAKELDIDTDQVYWLITK